jgi:hypothetical protein|nr:MAG TPA_asm: putative tail component [Caudoviricetes sp.]
MSFLIDSICNFRKIVKRDLKMSVKIQDNSKEISAEIKAALRRGLVKCGLVAEGYAKKLQKPDTGLLRNSITYAVSGEAPAITSYKADNPKPGRKNSGNYSGVAPEEKGGIAVYIGTNVEYAPYVELGTGSHTAGGRPTKWIYADDKGTHMTGGHQAKPFLKPAVADHAAQYRDILENELKNG